MTGKERIIAIEKRQAALAKKVKQAQDALYQLLLESVDRISKDPAYVEQVFKQYQKSEGVKLISAIAQDVTTIATYNYTYFLSYKDELDLSGKDFSKIQGTVDKFIKERIGLLGDTVAEDSFLSSILNDETVKQRVKQQAYASKMAGDGATAFRKNMKSLILGEEGKAGAVEGYYNTYVYDSYNQVDSAVQEQYSQELGLSAFVYEGGLISTSREFCRKKNGRCFLKSEALKEWPDELKVAKPANYQPLIHRGGYNCRHGISYVTNRRAMRMRDDLELVEGKLRFKS